MKITEDVRKYAAEPSGANRNGVEIARQAFLSMNAGKQIIHTMTRMASQQAISEEEALQRRMDKKSKEFVDKSVEVYAKV